MKLFAYLYSFLLKLRYDISIIGIENIKKNTQYIILPNHQALVDPQIIGSILGQKINLSPVVSETYYNIPILKVFFQLLGAIAMGDIQRGTGKKEDIDRAFEGLKRGISQQKNILLYPSGQLYSQGYEVIKGKKTSFYLTQNIPENVEILVVRTTGLWGSMWSKAWNGNTPNFVKTFISAIFFIFANFIFFLPKRKVQIEIQNYTKILKNTSDIHQFNQILEDYYNQNGEEKITYKKHFFYYNDIGDKTPPKISGSLEINTFTFDKKMISEAVKEKIFSKISEIKNISTKTLTFDNHLILDLYFDSLDIAEIKSYIQIQYPTSSNPPITELKTIGDLCLMAVGKSHITENLKPCNWNIGNLPEITLYKILGENKTNLGENISIISLFKEVFGKNKNESFVYDSIFGIQTKKDFLIKAYLLSSYIKKIDGKYIGVMLPSVSSASLIIVSIYLAGKIPVMLNWTVGETALLHCVKFSNLNNILTSKNFYDKIKNDGTQKLEEKYIFLENVLKDIPLTKKIKAVIDAIVFKIPKIKYNDEAVLLFTSGSESFPKAVSLTHKNIISDISGALYHFPITNKDILLGFLPPFHSFGFSINTIMPLISGLKTAYTPDPNDAKTLVNMIAHSQITAITSTPTFLKMILNIGEKNTLTTLKYAVVGAEKCPETLAENFSKYCPNGKILEGYGITECSPVISINPPGKAKLGSVGLPIFGSNIKIISLENHEILGHNQEGMIYFSGDNVFSGYIDSQLENPFEKIDGKIYYKTGDLGYVDNDGYLFITGRLKRFIKIAGEMISLPFIEGILSKKYNSDTEIKIALEAQEKNGQIKIVLFSQKELNLEEINAYLRTSGVSNLVKINEIQVISEIPILGTGKIDYKILKNMITF
ncbi:MAG: AMP-binding protein [Candidatus Altimarinota bacterium]